MTQRRTDFKLHSQGRLVGFCATSAAAEQWLTDNILSDPWQHSEFVLWVEEGLSRNLIDAVTRDGLMVDLGQVSIHDGQASRGIVEPI
jgi:hypothetical protein